LNLCARFAESAQNEALYSNYHLLMNQRGSEAQF